MKMHIDPKKLANAIASLVQKLGIRSEPGKVLFGLECLLTFFVLVVLTIFSAHDLIMGALGHPGEQTFEAFKLGSAGILVSIGLVIIRELLVGKFPNVR